MELDRSRWFVKWFFLSLGIWEEFTLRNGKLARKAREGTNLCFFMRVTLVWAPLVLVLHAVVYGTALYALTLYPIKLFGGSGYARVFGALAIIIGAIWGIHVLYARGAEARQERAYWRKEANFGNFVASHRPKPAKDPGALGVFWLWLVAQKQKICPMITWKSSEVAQ